MKLRCLFGKHKYAAEQLNVEALSEFDGGAIFRMTNPCVFCGKEYVVIVPIIDPVFRKGGNTETNVNRRADNG